MIIIAVVLIYGLFKPSNIPPQFYDVNGNNVFYLEYRNNSCFITSKIVGENTNLTLPAYSINFDLTKYYGKYTSVKGRVVYLKNENYGKKINNCYISPDRIVNNSYLGDILGNKHYVTSFIIDELPATRSADDQK